MSSHQISRISRASDISFKELLEKRKQIMQAKDEYIEIPLDNTIEMKNMEVLDPTSIRSTHQTKATNTPNIYDMLENQQTVSHKKKKSGCRNVACLISIIGLIALNDYLLVTYFI